MKFTYWIAGQRYEAFAPLREAEAFGLRLIERGVDAWEAERLPHG